MWTIFAMPLIGAGMRDAMVKKFVFLAGVGVGYLLGSKGGREKLMRLWNDPKVQDTVSHGTDWAKDKAPVLQEKVAGAAKDVAAAAKDKASPSAGSSGTSGSSAGTGSSAATGSGAGNGSFTTGGQHTMSPAEVQPEK